MLIEMLIQIDGYREGEPWPTPGDTLDVPDDEAAALIGCRYAQPAGDEMPETPLEHAPGVLLERRATERAATKTAVPAKKATPRKRAAKKATAKKATRAR